MGFFLQMGSFVFGEDGGWLSSFRSGVEGLDVTRTGSHPSIQRIFKSRSSSHLPVAQQQAGLLCAMGREVIKDLTPDAFSLN